MSSVAPSSVDALCERHGITRPFDMARIRAGRNSEVWRVFNGDGQWILKHYFQQEGDGRDRLGTEFNFLAYLSVAGVTGVARPVGLDRPSNRALYTFLPGTRPESITSFHIAQAAAFVGSINERRTSPGATALPAASEACFSLQDHIALAERRLARLLAVPPVPGVGEEARAFVADRLAPCWTRIANAVRAGTDPAAVTLPLPLESRILSPSDFGFHNSLEAAGTLRFVDFEYAGWDDPAKLLCDFICQPEMPVSADQGREFTAAVVGHLPGAGAVAGRVDRLLPVHRLKWLCILLNEFRDEDRLRRRHAGVDDTGLLAAQLAKARRYFDLHFLHFN